MEPWRRSRKLGASWPPTSLGKSKRYLEHIYIGIGIMTSHIWTFLICIVWMVQPGHHGPLDCIYNLSSGRKGQYIWLFAGYKQSRLQALWKCIEIVSDGTYSLTVNIRVQIIVDTSVFSYNAYKKYVQDPDCYDRRSEKKIKNGMKLKLRREFPVSTNTTTTALLLILHLLLYSTLVLLLLLLLLLVLLLYSTLLTTNSSTTPTNCLLYML